MSTATSARGRGRAGRARNPAFWPDQLRAMLGPERGQAALTDPDSLDLLVWNVFATLEHHTDQEWLAYRLQMFGGTGVRAPVRIQRWIGRDNEPLLPPSRGYLATVRQRAAAAGGDAASVAAFTTPIEVPVRIESPDVVVLVDATVSTYPRGAGGRDRIQELVDAGLEHAERLGKQLAIGVVYVSGTQTAKELSARLDDLRRPGRLAAELPYADPARLAKLVLREVSWQQLLRTWQAESRYLHLPSSAKPFLAHCQERGLL